MGAGHDLTRRVHLRAMPLPQRRGQLRAFNRLIGMIAAGSESVDRHTIRDHDGRIHPIQRGAAHRAKSPQRAGFRNGSV